MAPNPSGVSALGTRRSLSLFPHPSRDSQLMSRLATTTTIPVMSTAKQDKEQKVAQENTHTIAPPFNLPRAWPSWHCKILLFVRCRTLEPSRNISRWLSSCRYSGAWRPAKRCELVRYSGDVRGCCMSVHAARAADSHCRHPIRGVQFQFQGVLI